MRKRPKKRNESSAVRTSNTAVGLNPSVSSFAQIQLASQMGVSNVGRSFKLTQNYNSPQIALRTHDTAFPLGWSSGSVSDQDCIAAINTALDYDAELNPITPAAWSFTQRHWPLLNALLQSGVGSRYPTTMQEVVRYYSLTALTLQEILFPLQINYLTTAFPWPELPPYTDQIPPALWGLAELFDCNDIGVADVWKPLYDRLATKVLPPRFAASIMEQAFPYLGHPSSHCMRLQIPSTAAVVLEAWDLGSYITNILTRLDYLEDELIQCHNTLASFLPWRVGPSMAMFRGYDPVYEEIDFNTGLVSHDNFGDTGDPDEADAIVTGTAVSNGDLILYHHRGEAPLVKSVINTPIFDVTSDVDDTYINLSYGRGGSVYFVDDDLNLALYSGVAITSDNVRRYRHHYPNRFQFAGAAEELDFGVGRIGFSIATLAREEVVRIAKRYTSYLFGDDTLRSVLAFTGGASIRTIRNEVAAAFDPRG